MRRIRLPYLAIAMALVFASGCTRSVVYEPTTPDRVATPFAGGLVVETTYETTGMRNPELEDAILRSLQESQSAAAIFDARRLDVTVTQTAPIHVGFHVRAYRVSEDDPPPGGVAVVVLGSLLILPLAFLGVPRVETEYWVEYEVTVRALAGVPLTVLSTGTGGQPHYDVSAVPPTFRGSYRVVVHAGRNWIRSELGGGEDRQRHWYEVADQIGVRMVNTALPELESALHALRRDPNVAP